MVRKPVDSWGSPAKFLHWLIAALVLVQIALGWSAVTWRLSPLKLDLFVWHKSIGLLILGLMLLRVLWRFSHRAPELPAGTARWERHAARLSHLLLYGLLLAMPLSGWIVNSAANIPVRVFWLVRLPNLVDPSKTTEDIAARVHLLLFGVLALLLLVHVGAALRHHFVLRDNVLLRMLPGTRGGT